MARLIDLDELLKFPIRIDHYDKEHGNEHFVYGVETVLEYAENLPIVDSTQAVKVETNIYDKEEIYPDCTNRRFHIPDLADICMSAEEFCCLGERKENER